MLNIQKFSYNRYNAFVIRTRNDATIRVEQLKELLPFVIKDGQNMIQPEFLAIKNILKSEITKARSGRTFSTFENIDGADRFEIFIKQLMHYFTTYGLELRGEDVFIDNPYFNEVVKEIIPIDSLSKEEFIERFMKDIETTLQWTIEEIESIKTIIRYFSLTDKINLDKIPSKELKLILMDEFMIFPRNAEDFLRFLVYKLTGDSLLIKSKDTINAIKNKVKRKRYDGWNREYVTEENSEIKKYFDAYIRQYGYVPLAEIFNRFKPIFLALKNSYTTKIINKISKLSKKYHKPKGLPEYLQITEKIEKGKLNPIEFGKIISNMDTSYLIKLGNALKFRILAQEKNLKGEMFVIRNGKIWFQESTGVPFKADYKPYLNVILTLISEKIKAKLNEMNVTFNLENYKNYALPTSGKQFTGQIPNGTKIEGDWKILGVYWTNLGATRVDLDLSLTNESGKIGWNSSWYNDDTIFSGDMTDAAKGAAESFYFKRKDGVYSVKLNWFNHSGIDESCPFTLFFGNMSKEIRRDSDLPKTTMVDEIVAKVNMEIKSKEPQIQLGMVTENGFYFGHFVLPTLRSAVSDPKIVIDTAKTYLEAKIRFEDLMNIGFETPEEQVDEEGNVIVEKVDLDKARMLELVS